MLRNSVSLVAAGLIGGALGALALSPLISSLLVGVSPRDPATFVLLPVLMLVVTVIASLLPAARATRVDAMVALRYE
jgi:putative ABC transport system permease protein